MDVVLNLIIVFMTFIPGYFLGVFNFKIINYYVVIFWCSLVFCILGAFVIRMGIMDDSFFVAPIANKEGPKILGLFITCVSFFLFFFFCWITELLYNILKYRVPKCNVEWLNFTQRRVIKSSNLIVFGMLIFSVILFAYYYYTISPAPLLMALSGSSAEEVAVRRLAVTKDYIGVGYFRTLALIIPTIFSYLLLARLLLSRYKKTSIIFLTFFSLMLSIVTLLLNGEKAPLIFYFLGLLVLYSTIKPLKKKILFLFFGGIVFILLLMYVILFQFTDTNYMLYIIVERLFVAQEVSVFYAADYFNQHAFLGFSTLDNVFNKILGDTPGNRASELFMYSYLPEMVKNGGWNVNGYFAHETYSNFGLIGVVVGAAYGGIINAFLCIFFRTSTKTELTLSFYTFFVMAVTTVLSSFNAMLFNTQLILIFIIYIVFRLLDRKVENGI